MFTETQFVEISSVCLLPDDERLRLAMKGLGEVGYDPGFASAGPEDVIRKFLREHVEPIIERERERAARMWADAHARVDAAFSVMPHLTVTERGLLAAVAVDFIRQVVEENNSFDISQASWASLVSMGLLMVDMLRTGPWSK